MKNSIPVPLLFLIAGITAVSCKKSETTTFGASVNGTESLFISSIFSTPILNPNMTQRNYGYEFKVSKTGRITHLGAKITKGTFTVALWDSTAKAVLISANITNTDSTQFAYADIEDITIQAGKVYVITVFNLPAGVLEPKQVWYAAISSNANYMPRSIGDITFIASVERNADNAGQLFPYSFARTNFDLAGFPSFKFEPAL